jgi:hypothetical protein
MIANKAAKKKALSMNATVDANQGLTSDMRNCALMTAPKACKVPAKSMKGMSNGPDIGLSEDV